MSTRIYSVTPKVDTGPVRPRLIRASNQAQALRHVAKDTLNVVVASQNDLVSGLTSGITVEDAAAESDAQQDPLK